MKFELKNQEFRWISVGVPAHKRSKRLRHTSFGLGSLKVNVGDYVLVRNDDALDPEDILSCFVAEVKDLFFDEDEADPNQAHVQWYLRVSELPKCAQKSIKTEECEWEVIQDKSNLWAPWSSNVDAETIFQRCEILFLPVDTDWEASLSKYDDHPFPVFFCRYAFTGKRVVTVSQGDEMASLSSSEGSVLSSRKKKIGQSIHGSEKENGVSPSKKSKPSRKSKDQYFAASVSGSVRPKVVIKKIDSRVYESIKNGARFFDSVSEVVTVDDIAETFKQKLDIQSSESPLLHNLTVQKKTPKKQKKSSKVNGCPKELDIFSQTYKSKETPKKTGKISSRNSSPSKPKNSPRKSVISSNSSTCPSPKKRAKILESFPVDCLATTRSGRKVKAVNYSETGLTETASTPTTPSKKKVPRYVVDADSDSDECHFSSGGESSSDDFMSDCSFKDKTSKPQSKNRKSAAGTKTAKRLSVGLPITISKRTDDRDKSSRPFGHGTIKKFDLSIPERKTPLKTPQNVLEETRQRLHVSAVPLSLPCREEEYSDIYSFVRGCLCAQTGGCMYISGVPGTGKTATVHEVMRNLEEEKESGEVPPYKFVEVNGMWMTDPYQCYVHIYKALTEKTIPAQQAANLLEKRFIERGPKKEAVVLLVDELDRLWTRKQTVMYNIFDWPTKENSKLIVLAIANTMDLPERMMMNRISSRIGLTRKTFQPYTFKQLQEIILSRIQELKVFDPDAVQLVARKVAAVSGDARRALDICRFATEVINQKQSPRKKTKVLIGMGEIDGALQQMFSSPLISAIRSCSKMSKVFFQCLLSEFTRSGLEETTLLKVYKQVVACCRFDGMRPPNSTEIFHICANLATSHLLLVDNFQNDLHMKIRLNVSSDDVTYALSLH